MFAFLKNHPFPVEAFFESSLVLTFAVPQAQLRRLVPERLQLDTFNHEWAFIAVALVQTKGLRPKGFPRFMGNDFFLIGYRIFVRYTNKAGKHLRGLYILKSETNNKQMEVLGNIFTHYHYTTTDIVETNDEALRQIQSAGSGFRITIKNTDEEVALPTGSPFADWKQARRFAGPLPFTFACHQNAKEVLIIEGVRQNWTPKPVQVLDHHFAFLSALKLESTVLANAFVITDVPYHWKKGKLEAWQ